MDEQLEALRSRLDSVIAMLAEQQEVNRVLCRLTLAVARSQAAVPAVGRAMRDLEALRAVNAGRTALNQD